MSSLLKRKHVLAASKGVVTYQQQIKADGAIAYWPLDDPSGTTALDKVGTRHGTISGGVTLNQAGVNGSKCMVFNGTDGKVRINSTPIAFPQFTYEAWAYPITAPGTQMAIFGRDWNIAGGSVLERTELAGGPFRFQIPPVPPPANVVGTARSINTWYHVAVTHDGTTARLYINGAVDSSTTPFVLNVGDVGLTGEIGNLPGFAIYWNGKLQDIAIYNRALTPAEIQSHYTKRLEGAPFGGLVSTDQLVSLWDFDSDFQDKVGTNHLTNVNGVTRVPGKLGNAADFDSALQQYLSFTESSSLIDEDFTYAAWFKQESGTNPQFLFFKANCHGCYTDSSTIYFFIGDSTPGLTGVTYANPTVWHFVVMWHIASANTLNIQIDNGTVMTAPTTSPHTAFVTPIKIGQRNPAESFNGLIDQPLLFKRILSAAERTAMWNSGNGLRY